MKRLLFFLFLTPFLHATAQDLTGIWRGTFYTSQYEMLFGSANKYEVQIDNSGRALKGVTYSYQNTRFYGKASLIGMWTPGTKNLIFKEDNLMEYKMSDGGGEDQVSMFTCYLEYRKEGDKEILEGNYTSQLYRSHKDGGNGKIYLERVVNSDFKKEDFVIKKEKKDSAKVAKPIVKPQPTTTQNTKPQSPTTASTKPPVKKTTPTVKPKQDVVKSTLPKKPATPQAPIISQKDKTPDVPKVDPPKVVAKPIEVPKVKNERQNDLVKTILTSANEIEISLYDNGEIDGDTISVFLNGRQIAAHKGLSTRPITLKIKIDESNPDQELTMVAENLGSIPPNTALMVVTAGDQRYDLRISSSNQNNAVVRFKYQAPGTANK
jgi:hypothetical protein